MSFGRNSRAVQRNTAFDGGSGLHEKRRFGGRSPHFAVMPSIAKLIRPLLFNIVIVVVVTIIIIFMPLGVRDQRLKLKFKKHVQKLEKLQVRLAVGKIKRFLVSELS